jgi:hypothetical protein
MKAQRATAISSPRRPERYSIKVEGQKRDQKLVDLGEWRKKAQGENQTENENEIIAKAAAGGR